MKIQSETAPKYNPFIGPTELTQEQQDKIVLANARLIIKRQMKDTPVFDSAVLVKDHFLLRLHDAEREHFEVLFLDTQHREIETIRMFSGTINCASVYPREIVRKALMINAQAIIVAHNHPSGNPTPSDSDRKITRKISNACEALDISLLDHIVIGKTALSFAERGYSL